MAFSKPGSLKVLKARLTKEIEIKRDLSDHQCGFKRGKSTLDATEKVIKAVNVAEQETWRTKNICVLVTSDVANAFNSDFWSSIIENLQKKKEVSEDKPQIRRGKFLHFLDTNEGIETLDPIYKKIEQADSNSC